MSFTAKIEPSVAMIGNPILVKVQSSGEPTIRITVSRNNSSYEAAAVPDSSGQCVFSIHDLFSDAFPSVPPEADTELLKAVPESMLEYTVRVSGKRDWVNLSGRCYPGGISRKLMRHLANNGTDIFTAKFCNPRTNFFLTSRTGDSIITMRENEIGYLYCVGMGWNITISDLHGHNCELKLPDDRKIYALNLPEIRRQFWDKGTLSSYFSISVNNKAVAIVAITPGIPDATVLMFKNSYGVYEKIELSGVINVLPEIKKQEIVYKYDQLISDFTGTAARGSYTPVLTVESGHKTIRELEFLQELFLSEDVYLVNGNELIHVMVSTTKMKYRKPLSEPESIEIKITFCDDEQYGSAAMQYISAILADKASTPITDRENRKIQVNKNVEL